MQHQLLASQYSYNFYLGDFVERIHGELTTYISL